MLYLYLETNSPSTALHDPNFTEGQDGWITRSSLTLNCGSTSSTIYKQGTRFYFVYSYSYDFVYLREDKSLLIWEDHLCPGAERCRIVCWHWGFLEITVLIFCPQFQRPRLHFDTAFTQNTWKYHVSALFQVWDWAFSLPSCWPSGLVSVLSSASSTLSMLVFARCVSPWSLIFLSAHCSWILRVSTSCVLRFISGRKLSSTSLVTSNMAVFTTVSITSESCVWKVAMTVSRSAIIPSLTSVAQK